MIPKNIHCVWVGPRTIPETSQRLMEGWREHNPDYEFILWNEDNIDFSNQFVRGAYAVGAWNRVANFARAAALHKYGGIYLDTDMELRRPLDPLLDNSCFLGFQRRDPDRDWVNCGIMGAVPGHWFMERTCQRLVEEFDGRRYVASSSGPGLVTQLLVEEGLTTYDDAPQFVRDVTVYPVRYFYPYFLGESFTEACVTPDTFAIHHWASTWIPKRDRQGRDTASLPQRLLNRLARYSPEVAYAAMMTRVRLARKLAA
jgi:mannosyltransferase OCH1-like enzyme